MYLHPGQDSPGRCLSLFCEVDRIDSIMIQVELALAVPLRRARIAVDGAHIASGSTGQVIHLTFTVQHGHLHVERV